MTQFQQILCVAICAAGVMLTRFLPFLLFRSRNTSPYVRYLGVVLPSAVFGMLVVYCLKNVDFLSGSYGLPEAAGIVVTALLHVWKRQMLVSIAGGTFAYMVIVQNFL